LNRIQARLNAINKRIDNNQKLGKPITISEKLMSASEANKGVLPYSFNPYAMDRYQLDSKLKDFGVSPTTALSPKVQNEIDQYLQKNITGVSQSGFKETDKFFQGIKEILQQNMLLNQQIIDSNNKVNKNLDTIVSQNNTANDQRDKQVKYAANA